MSRCYILTHVKYTKGKFLNMDITPKKVRGARAMLGLSQAELAKRAGLSKLTINDYENETKSPRQTTLTDIKRTLEEMGIEFTRYGVQEKHDLVTVLEDKDSVIRFFDDVYYIMREEGGELLEYGINEERFDELQGDTARPHILRMSQLQKTNNYTCRCLISENDDNVSECSYAEYRQLPEKYFMEIPFFVYGRKIAIVLWESTPTRIIILNDPELNKAYRKQFDALWKLTESGTA